MRRILLLGLCLSLLACGRPDPIGFRNTDISGGDIGHSLAGFRDHRGQARTLSNFEGRVLIVFFGYTHCPDVCPTILTRLSSTMKRLGPDAQRVQVLMVTVDPARDTPERLAAYMTAFNPSFLGLYSDHATTEAAASAFKVFYSPNAAPSSDHSAHGHAPVSAPVLIDHSAGSYIFDTKGKIQLYVRDDAPVDAIVSDLKWLLGQS